MNRNGDRDRFEALFDAYHVDVVAYCAWRAGTPADADDAVSEVYATTWRRLRDVPDGDAGRVWLYATARRVIANQRRSGRRRAALRQRIAHHSDEAWPQAAVTSREEGLVHEALAALSPRDREVLLLAEWEGLRADEIAEVMGCLAVTARGRLHRARDRFRAAFEALARNEVALESVPLIRKAET